MIKTPIKLLRCSNKLLISLLIVALLVVAIVVYKSLFSKPTHFIITTHGGTASTWLAGVLSSKTEVACSHYISGIKNSQIKQSIYSSETLSEYFKRLDKNVGKRTKYTGNVNGFYYADLKEKLKTYPKVIVVNLTRHPVARIDSMTANWLSGGNVNVNSQTELYLYNGAVQYCNAVNQRYAVDCSNNVKNFLFLNALAQQDEVYKDIAMSLDDGVVQVRKEDVTTDYVSLATLFRIITNGEVKLTPVEGKKLLQNIPKNKHSSTEISDSERYENWQEWQQYAFYLHLRNNNALDNNVYSRLNYDLSYIKKF